MKILILLIILFFIGCRQKHHPKEFQKANLSRVYFVNERGDTIGAVTGDMIFSNGDGVHILSFDTGHVTQKQMEDLNYTNNYVREVKANKTLTITEDSNGLSWSIR